MAPEAFRDSPQKDWSQLGNSEKCFQANLFGKYAKSFSELFL